MTPRNMPAAEVDVDAELVRALLVEQHPDLAHLSLRPLGVGWDNVMFRLGDELTVRLPRRLASAVLVEHEQRWLPHIAPRLPLAIPAPVRVGRPSLRFAWAWTIGPWLPGDIAAQVPPHDPRAAAQSLGRFLHALHQPAPLHAPPNPYRGVPLHDRDPATHECIAQLESIIDGASITQVWTAALEVPPFDGPPRWLHGDLHPANILVDHGQVSAVIDFGDITAGDPATDLAVAWMLFDPPSRAWFRVAAAGPDAHIDDSTWARARGWALSLALAYLAHSADNEVMAAVGHRTLAAVLGDKEDRPTRGD